MKTCNSGSPCMHRAEHGMSVGYICNYDGYCDFQLPRDSRMQPLFNGTIQECQVCHKVPCICMGSGGNSG